MSGQNYDAPVRAEANVAVPDDQAGAYSKLSSQYIQHGESSKAVVAQNGQSPGENKALENAPNAAGGRGNESLTKDGEGHRHNHMGMPPNEAEKGEARSDFAKSRRLEEKGLLPPGEGILDHGKEGGLKHGREAGLKQGESCVTTPTMESITKTHDGTTIINSASTTVCRPTHEGRPAGHAAIGGEVSHMGMPVREGAVSAGRAAAEGAAALGKPPETSPKVIDKHN